MDYQPSRVIETAPRAGSHGDKRLEVFFLKEVSPTWGVDTSSCRFPDSSTNTAHSLRSAAIVVDDEECFPMYRSTYSRKSTASSNTLKGKLLSWMSLCFWNCSAGCQKVPNVD